MDSAPQTQVQNVPLDEAEAVASYRSVSVLAVAAIIVSLPSPLALVASPLVIIPAAGLFLALLALRQIATSGGVTVGRSLALTALALSVCFGTAAVSAGYIQTRLLAQQARPWAQVYIDLIRDGQLAAAYELGLPPQQRQPLDADLDTFYAAEQPRIDALNDFQSHAFTRILTDLSKDDRVEFVRLVDRRERGTRQYITLQYRVDYADNTRNDQSLFIRTEEQPGIDPMPSAWIIIDRGIVPREL